MINSKWILYSITSVLFTISLIGVLYYGYKTFYIDSGQAEPKDYSYHFALIAEEMDNEYWQIIEQGAKQAADEHGIYLEFVAPQKANNDQNLTLLDRMIAAKVDGIITQGIRGDRFKDIVHKGVERGIPIITIDADAEESERKSYVGSENVQAGKQLGEAFINQTTGEQFVGIILGRFDAINQQERMNGFKQAIANTPRIQIVAMEESNITKVGASRATYTLMKRNPKINSLVGLSALDGIGMVEGLQDIVPNKNVFLAVFDVMPDTLQLIEEGKINLAISQNPQQMGETAVQLLIELQQRDLLDNLIYTKSKIITNENLPDHVPGVVK